MQGYLRHDGKKGIRNVVAVVYLVECAHHVAREVTTPYREQGAHLIGFPGCYPNAYAQKMMSQLCTHPNVGAVLAVSLGCESFNRSELAKTVEASGRLMETLVIQEAGGTRTTIQQGRECVQRMLDQLQDTPRVEMTPSDLVIGTICGGSDATSGITANPAIGIAFDQLVQEGAACLFEETGELIGCESHLARRAVTPELATELTNSVDKARLYYQTLGHGSFASGNAVGELTTQEEKSMGAYVKSGTSPISGLLKPGDVPNQSGLYLLDVVPDGEVRFGFPNISDNAEIGELIACGAHLILFATGRGSVVGSAISPVIKICGNPQTYSRLQEDMDINAGTVLEGSTTLAQVGGQIYDCVIETSSGRPTASESLGHQEFIMTYKQFEPIGPSCLPAKAGLLSLLLFFACLLGIATATELSAAEQRPNIVFVFSDDHALQSIGAYGSKINETPNIDRIGREGAVFLNSFCANSICGPSRACILTGKHSHKNGFLRNGNRFDGTQTTFPKLIQEAGYQTAMIGKWHLSSDPTGFDHWEVLPGQGSYYNPDFIQMDGSRKRRMGYCTDIITDLSLNWLKERDSEKPFVLMCQHKAPHRNWAPPQRYFALYKENDVPEPSTLQDDYSGRTKLLKQNEMSIREHMSWAHDMKLHGEIEFPEHFKMKGRNGEYARMTDEQKRVWDEQYEPENQAFISQLRSGSLSEKQILSWKYQRYIKDYLRCIAAVDEGVGRLLAYLDETGLAENTIVIYSSDQGFYLGDHGWYDKRWMFEESMKMPFLIRWPGKIAEGTRTPTLIQNIDYAPTFLELAGASIPSQIQGRSLVPVLQGNCAAPSDWRDSVYYAYYENDAVHNVPKHDGVRSDRYKLMFFPRSREWNLFDLEVDPQELTSRHDDPKYADVLRIMKQRYRDQRSLFEVNSAVIPETRGDDKHWKRRENLLKDRVKKGSDQVRLAFIGDSITNAWEENGKSVWEEKFAPRQAVNLGIGGDRTEHVIWRLQNGGGFSKIKPEVAVVMIGTNNTGHFMQDPAEVAAGIKRILEIIADQSPETKVVLHGIFPRGRTELDEKRLNNQAINQRIRRFADGKNIHWLDIGKVFLEPDNSLTAEIMPDALHLSKLGYQRWAEAVEPKLKELGL